MQPEHDNNTTTQAPVHWHDCNTISAAKEQKIKQTNQKRKYLQLNTMQRFKQ